MPAVNDFDTEEPATIEAPKPQPTNGKPLQVTKLCNDSIMLFNANCFDVLPHLRANTVDMVFADLPYGTTKCKWDIVLPFEPLWADLLRIGLDTTPFVFTGGEPFSSLLRLSQVDIYRYDWYWQKDKGANFLFGNKQPLKIIETVSVFYRKQPVYNPQKEINPRGISKRHLSPNPSKISQNVRDIMGETWRETEMGETQNYHGANYEPDKLLPKSLIYFAREQRGKKHPTQKPIELLEYLIRTYTNEGDLVLDPTMGSGTTAVACKHLKRRCIGIEMDRAYFDIAVQRVINE